MLGSDRPWAAEGAGPRQAGLPPARCCHLLSGRMVSPLDVQDVPAGLRVAFRGAPVQQPRVRRRGCRFVRRRVLEV
eukprot:11181315-Lingulodinium_polyedra.AAC.1